MGETGLAAPAVRERGLLDHAGMATFMRRLRSRRQSAHGFSLVELLLVVALIAVLSGIAVGITPGVIRSAKGSSGASQVSSVLRRAREMAISRRRNIRVTFQGVNQVVLEQINVPGPGTTALQTIRLEGRVEYARFAILDTPDGFGNATAVQLGGATPVMFTSEGMFTDANGDPTNATIRTGIPGQVTTANAITILGATATIRQYRWDGSRWVE
jgi:prepilin-type N-terminal cleavage/methylation domain-containing protein